MIFCETNNYRYSIHPGTTKICCNLRHQYTIGRVALGEILKTVCRFSELLAGAGQAFGTLW